MPTREEAAQQRADRAARRDAFIRMATDRESMLLALIGRAAQHGRELTWHICEVAS